MSHRLVQKDQDAIAGSGVMERDTIVALSTPPGESAIAVVRLSGPQALQIVAQMAPGTDKIPSHKLHRCILRGEDDNAIDEVVLAIMRAPSSYTGEDMVEIFCHGGYQVVTDIIGEVTRLGARGAGHGEFTKRAFLNGKMDLSQAEAVADLISAETRLQRIVALEQLEGTLSKRMSSIERRLLDVLALVEVSIDFSEEDVPVYEPEELIGELRKVEGEIEELLSMESAGERLKNGIRVTILGPRNAGKSSLYNALLGEERAIVSSIPGTTRDILRERIHIGGFTYFLEDTAGLADTGCEIEAKGISKGKEAARRAEAILFVIDGSERIDRGILEEIDSYRNKKVIIVINKKDLGIRVDLKELQGRFDGMRTVEVSAKTGEGLETLREALFELTAREGLGKVTEGRLVINSRQGNALRKAKEAVNRAVEEIRRGAPSEIVSIEVKQAIDSCGEVTGRSVSEDLLETIFSRFCIGK